MWTILTHKLHLVWTQLKTCHGATERLLTLQKKKYTMRMGFEPMRAKHNGLAVHLLNLSDTSSGIQFFRDTTGLINSYAIIGLVRPVASWGSPLFPATQASWDFLKTKNVPVCGYTTRLEGPVLSLWPKGLLDLSNQSEHFARELLQMAECLLCMWEQGG